MNAELLGSSEEQLIRAVALSHLVTIHIKSKFGRISGLCGVTVSATGASYGIAYLLGGGEKGIKAAIQNMLGNVTGMMCDGAKGGCAMKVATCTSAALQSANKKTGIPWKWAMLWKAYFYDSLVQHVLCHSEQTNEAEGETSPFELPRQTIAMKLGAYRRE